MSGKVSYGGRGACFSRSARLIRIRHVILIAIIALGAWALWPPGDTGGATTTIKLGRTPRIEPGVKHVLKIFPGIYLPGTMPGNVGRPLQGMNIVADEFEKLFPDTRIEYVGVPSGQREWLVTQLSSGQAPDIIMVNVEDVWQDVQKGWYIPLDRWLYAPNPFVPTGEPGSERWWDMFKYPVPTQGTMAPDGKMYCIVLDMIETGIYYNKDLFDRHGLDVPRDWEQFISAQERLKQAGHTPMMVPFTLYADWGVDLVFDQLYYDLRPLLDLNYDPNRGEYLKGYLDWDEIAFLHTKGFFTRDDPRWVQMWRILKHWRQYFTKDLASTDFVREFVTQRGAMMWSTSMFVNQLRRDPDITFDWDIFYVPPIPKSFSRFAAGREQAVIGGSGMQYEITSSAIRDTRDVETSERLQRAVAFLQFLTLPRNTDTVVNEMIALLPNIKGVDPHPDLQPFDDFLQQHYSMTKWVYTFDLRFKEIMERTFQLYLDDGLDEEQFLSWMERNIELASESITRRKNLDFSELQRVWEQRKPMRQEAAELPDAAR